MCARACQQPNKTSFVLLYALYLYFCSVHPGEAKMRYGSNQTAHSQPEATFRLPGNLVYIPTTERWQPHGGEAKLTPPQGGPNICRGRGGAHTLASPLKDHISVFVSRSRSPGGEGGGGRHSCVALKMKFFSRSFVPGGGGIQPAKSRVIKRLQCR